MNVYAAMPPMVDSDQTFYGVPENMVVKVYSTSHYLYETAPYWKDYKIMTLDEDDTALTVYLPEDAADGRYRNAAIRLDNLSTGQTHRLLITGTRTQYVFGNLIPDTKYSLYVFSPNGVELGSELDFNMPQEGKEIKLAALKQMKPVTLSLLTPEGADVSDQATISWFDNNHSLLGNGSTLTGQLTGDMVNYEVTLSRDLGTAYKNVADGSWTIKDENNIISITLTPLTTTSISGKVTEEGTGNAIEGAYVTIAQKLNGQHDIAKTATAGADGSYSIDLYDEAGTLTAGSPDHIEMSWTFRDGTEAAALANVALKQLTGTDVTLSVLSRPNVEKGTTASDFTPYADYAAVTYSARNLTKGIDVDFRLRYPVMTILTPTDEGDEIEITAVPAKSGMLPATAIATIADDKGDARIELISAGDIRMGHAGCAADEVVALLYDGNGNLVRKSLYEDNAVAFNGVGAGKYTVVTMMASQLFADAGTLTDLSSSKLTVDTDYILSTVNVSDGFYTLTKVGQVPVFDESMFLYTGNETSMSVNKTSVTVGAIVTVRSKVEFLPEYAGRIGSVKMTFNIPEGCDYVDNSLLVGGNGAWETTVSDRKITLVVNEADASPRFCIIPRAGGDFRPSATIEFNVDGETVTQPIGSTLFTAGDFTLSVPPHTSMTRITARGATTALSDIKVYDNDVLVGSTRSLTNGSWRLSFDLYNPGDVSNHVIRAEITTPEGIKYRTAASNTLYEKNWAELTDIDIIYGGSTIDFNHVDATTAPASYSYVPGNDMFTFKTRFREGHAEKVKELYFVILLSDGSYRKMEGVFIPSTSTWTCAIGFADVNRLPVNVKAYYVQKDTDEVLPEWRPEEGTTFRCPDVIPVIDPSGYVYEAVPSNRLSGVQATIFYKEFTEDMYGDVHEKMTKWDAEAYAQENPLFTDEEGMYQWDVPQGEWMVRFEKDGYETASTDWLPVPPPQLDVNMGMKQMVHPSVKEAHAYDQSVEIEFDKYMNPLQLNTSTIVVTVNGAKADGKIVLINPEESDGETYASAVRFEADQPLGGDKVSLMVSNLVTSYAGITMEDAFVQEFPIEPKISAINVPETTECYIGTDGTISVEVLPADGAAGKTLKVVAASSIVTVEDNIILDGEGKAKIAFKGDLPGVVDIAVSVEGSSLPASVTRLTLTLSPIMAESVTLNKRGGNKTMGDEFKLTATVLPENTTDKTIVWTSSDESIATVDENGDVTIVGVGTATINAACGEVSATYLLRSYPQVGDANWSGSITITDAVDISNYVVKKKTVPEGWNADQWLDFYTVGANANEDEDGNITTADASAAVKLALAQPVAASAPNRVGNANGNENESMDALVIGAVSESANGTLSVAINLDNSMDYVALQADLYIPDGMDIEVKAGSRAANHSLETMRFDDNHIRVALFNFGNKAFAEGNEPLLEIVGVASISDVEDMTISNILASDSEAKEYVLSSRSETTGVESISNGDVEITKVADGIHISNAAGKMIEIYTLDGKIVKTFVAKDSLEIVNLPEGIYIVKAADKNLKVRL